MGKTLAKITNVESDGRFVWIIDVSGEIDFYRYQLGRYYPYCRGKRPGYCPRVPHVRLRFEGGSSMYHHRDRKHVYWCQKCLPSKWRQCIEGALALARPAIQPATPDGSGAGR